MTAKGNGQQRWAAGRTITAALVKAKANLYADLHIYRMTILLSGSEAPLPDGVDGFFIEPKSQAADHANIPWMALIVDDDPVEATHLEVRRERVGGVLHGGGAFGLLA